MSTETNRRRDESHTRVYRGFRVLRAAFSPLLVSVVSVGRRKTARVGVQAVSQGRRRPFASAEYLAELVAEQWTDDGGDCQQNHHSDHGCATGGYGGAVTVGDQGPTVTWRRKKTMRNLKNDNVNVYYRDFHKVIRPGELPEKYPSFV